MTIITVWKTLNITKLDNFNDLQDYQTNFNDLPQENYTDNSQNSQENYAYNWQSQFENYTVNSQTPQ